MFRISVFHEMFQKVYHRHFSAVYKMKLSWNMYFMKSLKEIFHSVSSSLRNIVMKICSKFTGEHPCWNAILIKNKVSLQHACSPVHLMHMFRTAFPKDTSGKLLLDLSNISYSLKNLNVKLFQLVYQVCYTKSQVVLLV